MTFHPLAPVPGLAVLAATPAAGYTMINGTGTIITWTAPNDGNLHYVLVFSIKHVTSNETGGDVNLAFTNPAGGTKTTDFIGAGKTIDDYACDFPQWQFLVTTGGGTVTLAQNTALTGGASKVYAALWGA